MKYRHFPHASFFPKCLKLKYSLETLTDGNGVERLSFFGIKIVGKTRLLSSHLVCLSDPVVMSENILM